LKRCHTVIAAKDFVEEVEAVEACLGGDIAYRYIGLRQQAGYTSQPYFMDVIDKAFA